LRGKLVFQRLDPGGLEILDADFETFAKALTSSNHTLKRASQNPRLFSGIGNAYSDEILFHARLSPIALTQKLTTEQVERLFAAINTTLNDWLERLRAEVSPLSPASTQNASIAPQLAFPEKVTAFREGMAVHGRYNNRV